MPADRAGGRKRVFIKTWGCQMNVEDSGRMAALLAAEGWQEQDQPHGADLIILNTCHIREKAAEKIYSAIGRLPLAGASSSTGAPLLAIAGCMAQAEGEEVFRRAPRVDMIFGPQALQHLPRLVGQAQRARKTGAKTPLKNRGRALHFAPEEKFEARFAAASPAAKISSFLTVQEGCDKFCSFCVVPYTRGAEMSRAPEDILAAARQLLAGGAKEIILLGQNVNAWRGQSQTGQFWPFARLLAALAALPGLRRLRYTTSHPRDLTASLIAAHSKLEVLMPQLHLPVQSGSDRILQAMNRKHTSAFYLAQIAALRQARPDIALSSDMIAGYPGETSADFAASCDLLARARFAQTFIFRYSARPGTPASRHKPPPASVCQKRLAELQALAKEQSLAFNRQFTGQKLETLLAPSAHNPGILTARTPHGVLVHADLPASAQAGAIVPMEIVKAGPHALIGRVC